MADAVPLSRRYTRLVNDSYLAAFAMVSARCLVTLDGAFDQFRGLEVEILGD